MQEKHSIMIQLFGLVQGVGMRYFIRNLANKLIIKGYVKNCDDGSVKCIAQANKDQLETFINAIKTESPGRINHIKHEKSLETTIFKSFDITGK